MVVVDLMFSMLVKAMMATAEASPRWKVDFQLCGTAACCLGSEAGPLLSNPKLIICCLDTIGIMSPWARMSGKALDAPGAEVGRRFAAIAMPPSVPTLRSGVLLCGSEP